MLPDVVEKVVRLDGRFAVHCLIGFLVGIGIAEIELIDHDVAQLVILALIAFAGIAAAIVFAGRDSRGLRWIAYVGFSLQLAFVYTVTMGTMLGTAGLFFASGIVLGLVAFLIIRIEKRMNAAPCRRRSRIMMTANRTILAALVVALAQIGFLGWIIAGRAAVLRDGREITLKVEPVDPRDLLRGDYVSLYYEISRIPVSQITNLPQEAYLSAESPLYVRVKKGGRRLLASGFGDLDAPLEAAPGADEADIRGIVGAGWDLSPGTSLDPDYGIERFYLPEGEGMESSRTCASGRSACASRFLPTARRRSRRCSTATSRSTRSRFIRRLIEPASLQSRRESCPQAASGRPKKDPICGQIPFDRPKAGDIEPRALGSLPLPRRVWWNW